MPAGAILKVGDKGPLVVVLRKRLAREGDLPAEQSTGTTFDAEVAKAVKRFQARHGLSESGAVRAKTLEALNVSAEQRHRQLVASIKRLMGSRFSFGERYVVVNIPPATVEAVEIGQVVRRYVAVVGKADRPSPEVETRITAVNLNPTWTVPVSLIKKDIIPNVRKDVTSDWIVPFYQPKVDLMSGKLDGFEALLRWRHPRTGIHTPATIAPAFDDIELGRAIGARMLSCVVKDVRGWLDAGLEVGRIAINASTAEFRYGDYAERMLEELARAGVPTACLEVEVTESVFLGRSAGTVERALRTLSGAGVTIALDDFGTGYASLTHLKRFPVDVIKLDHSFIRDMETDASDAAIVQAMLSLSQSLGITVVAEGVETPTQASILREQGCDLGQGYHFGRPMPAKDIPQCMRLWMRSAPEKASERLQEIQRQH